VNLDDVKHAIKSAQKPLDGVIQMAMVLNDVLLSEMTHSEWDKTLKPGVQGT
jgi:KR domain